MPHRDVVRKLPVLPAKPGVYLMKDASDTVLYVGKANSLKDRVRSYFGSSSKPHALTGLMLPYVRDIDYIVTANGVEALILENNLIKKYRPLYNIRLKDDKGYPYLRITANTPFPSLKVVNHIVEDGARYLGPFVKSHAVRKTVKDLTKIFPIRTCDLDLQPSGNDHRVCLDYHIGRCCGPCADLITPTEYRPIVKNVTRFFNGNTEEVVITLTAKMDNAVSHLDFERAAKYRDQITAIQQAIHQQNVENPMAEDEDIIGIAFQENQACVVLMMVRNGSLVDREPHFLSNVLPDLMTESLTAFIQQYYAEAALVPKTIVLPTEIEMADTIQDWLTERRHELTDGKSTAKVQLQTPQRGRKRQLLDLARQNARLAIEKKDATHLADKADLPDDRSLLSDLQDLLNLPEVPKRIEGFDISNLGEQLPVASMVVAIDGKPKYSEYRRFRIKTVAGQNDFAMMKEVIERRFQRSVKENLFPDLVLVDGGKGQLNAACQALEQLGLSHLPIIGLAKQQEHIFIPNRSEPIVLRHDNPTLHLIQRLRNEAHRLAINYHRKLRRLALKQSILDQIPLVGEKRKQALLLHFGSMDKIREASVTNLLDVAQIDLKVAENIYHYFRDQDVKYQ